jgi:hypothetical protein
MPVNGAAVVFRCTEQLDRGWLRCARPCHAGGHYCYWHAVTHRFPGIGGRAAPVAATVLIWIGSFLIFWTLLDFAFNPLNSHVLGCAFAPTFCAMLLGAGMMLRGSRRVRWVKAFVAGGSLVLVLAVLLGTLTVFDPRRYAAMLALGGGPAGAFLFGLYTLLTAFVLSVIFLWIAFGVLVPRKLRTAVMIVLVTIEIARYLNGSTSMTEVLYISFAAAWYLVSSYRLLELSKIRDWFR